MKYLFLLLFIFSCASNNKVDPKKSMENLEINDETPIVVTLPKTPKEAINRSPFFNTTKQIISRPNGFNYEFYYGSGGRYIVVVIPPKHIFVDFSYSEGTLIVAPKDVNPEILSLSVDKKGMFLGNGDTRNGRILFQLNITIPASRYNSSLNDTVDFYMNINDQY